MVYKIQFIIYSIFKKDAVNWAIDEKIAEKDKIAIYGGSYGGYAVLAGLTFTPDVFAVGVDIVGPSNLGNLLFRFFFGKIVFTFINFYFILQNF